MSDLFDLQNGIVLTKGTSSVNVTVKSEDLYTGIRYKSPEQEHHKCQDHHESRISLQDVLVLVVSRYLKFNFNKLATILEKESNCKTEKYKIE